MPRHPASTDPTEAARRRAVVRTALIVGGIALLVYAVFILSGVLGTAPA